MVLDVGRWLRDLGLDVYAEAFANNDIDAQVLIDLSNDDLKDLGVVSVGHRRRILRAIDELSSSAPSPNPQPAPAADSDAARDTRSDAERRQLTVLFCDLVGSTALSSRLDPEDMRNLLRRYQDAVAGVVGRHDGYVGNYLGDGVLAYFGWPRAHEDQAAQAVRAGMAAVQAVADLAAPDGEVLAARSGIATGQVVVGDLLGETSRQADAVSGETPNLAARLQALAEPGQVVIGGLTRDLLGRQFELAAMGHKALKGIPEPVPAWRVIGEAAIDSRFEARGGNMLGFVGREHELGLLEDRWRMARDGEGQVVVLSGEAGIGKSRLTQELRRRVESEDCLRLAYQCAPQYANSAFFPVIRQLRGAAGLAVDDDPDVQLDKLEALLGGDPSAARLFAELMSVPCEERYGALQIAPEVRKQHIFRALIDKLLDLSAQRPVVFLFEDAHWIDPSSAELLIETVPQIRSVPVLMIVTARPEWQAPWSDQPHASALSLSRVGRDQAAEIAVTVAGPQVDREAIERIVARTDGIPLFIEELTKSLVESGVHAAEADIPATLQASLAARLDGLDATAKEIAQIGSAIGREFDRDLLAAVANCELPVLDRALDQLLASQLVLRMGQGEHMRYGFKHALVQDAAYDSLLRERRRIIHRDIATVLESAPSGRWKAEPEVIARHRSAAGDAEKATVLWRAAAEQAAAKSAYAEARVFLDHALDTARQLLDDGARSRAELHTHVASRPVFGALGDYPSVLERIVTAESLAERLGDAQLRIQLATDRTHVLYHLGQIEAAVENGERAKALAFRTEEPELILPAVFNLGQAHYFAGDGNAALAQVLDHVAKLHSQLRHARLGGTGTSACTWLGNVGGAYALLGKFQEARMHVDLACEIAGETGSLFDRGQSGGWRAFVRIRQGEIEETIDELHQIDDGVEEHNIGFQRVWIRSLLTEAYRQIGRVSEAVESANIAIEEADWLGLVTMGMQAKAALCEVLAAAEAADTDLAFIRETLDSARSGGFRLFEVQCLRALGQTLMAYAEPEWRAAENCFNEALASARALAASPDVAHTRITLGVLYSRLGDSHKANAEWQLARNEYRRMGMTSFERSVPAEN